MPSLPTDTNDSPNYTPAQHADHHNDLHAFNNAYLPVPAVYQQDSEPVGAPDGSWWVDTDEPSQSGSSVWTQTVNESGASFANWTAVGGTWSSDGTVINQTATGATFKHATYTATQPLALCAVEADVRINSGSGNPQAASILLGGSTGAIEIRVHTTNGTNYLVTVEEHAVAVRIAAVNVPGGGGPYNTWATIRALSAGAAATVWVNGTLIGTAAVGTGGDLSLFRLSSFNSNTSYRNIRLWTHSVPW